MSGFSPRHNDFICLNILHTLLHDSVPDAKIPLSPLQKIHNGVGGIASASGLVFQARVYTIVQ
jgi:hypothetical protein